MDDLVNRTLNCLKDSANMVSLNTTFKMFLEGLKTITNENILLKEEMKQKCAKITALETQVSTLLDEKVDVANSIEFNAAAIKKCEEYATKINELEKNLKEADACKNDLNEKIATLENKIDDTDAYERRDCVILSGAVPPSHPMKISGK